MVVAHPGEQARLELTRPAEPGRLRPDREDSAQITHGVDLGGQRGHERGRDLRERSLERRERLRGEVAIEDGARLGVLCAVEAVGDLQVGRDGAGEPVGILGRGLDLCVAEQHPLASSVPHHRVPSAQFVGQFTQVPSGRVHIVGPVVHRSHLHL